MWVLELHISLFLARILIWLETVLNYRGSFRLWKVRSQVLARTFQDAYNVIKSLHAEARGRLGLEGAPGLLRKLLDNLPESLLVLDAVLPLLDKVVAVLDEKQEKQRIVGVVEKGVPRFLALVVANLVYHLVVLVRQHLFRLLGPQHRADSYPPVQLLHLVRREELQVRLENGRVRYVVVVQLVFRKISEFLLRAFRVQVKSFPVKRLERPEN